MAKKTKFGDVHMNSLNMTELCKKNLWLIILQGIQNTVNTEYISFKYQALGLSGTECLTHMRKNCLGRSAFLLTCDAALPFTLSVRRFTVWLRLLCTPHDTVLHTICSLCFELILKLIFFLLLKLSAQNVLQLWDLVQLHSQFCQLPLWVQEFHFATLTPKIHRAQVLPEIDGK